jgi:hypothetical protein
MDAATVMKPPADLPSAPAATGGNVGGRRGPLPQGYPGDLAKPDQVRVQMDLSSARAAVREYQMTHDSKNPPDIGSLHLNLSYPGDITYDANSGTVKSRTYPMW